MTLTPPAILNAATMMGLCVGDVVQFESSAYGRMMFMSMGKHVIKFMTRNVFVHEEPRPVRNKFRVVDHVDLGSLEAAAAAKEKI